MSEWSKTYAPKVVTQSLLGLAAGRVRFVEINVVEINFDFLLIMFSPFQKQPFSKLA